MHVCYVGEGLGLLGTPMIFVREARALRTVQALVNVHPAGPLPAAVERSAAWHQLLALVVSGVAGVGSAIGSQALFHREALHPPLVNPPSPRRT